ncbi:hypothetical protein MauCBS54593_005587 [Microsporum audouinii]
MATPSVKSSSPNDGFSATWQAAIDRYFDELKEGGAYSQDIEHNLWNVHSSEELLDKIRTQSSMELQGSKSLVGLSQRLEPILVSFNDFAAIITLAAGMNNQAMAVIWGSIRLILELANPVPRDLLDMFDEMGRAFPRFCRDKPELPLTSGLENALLSTYTEIILLCAHSISYFQNNPNPGKREVWSTFSTGVSQRILRIQLYSRLADEAADMIRLSGESKTSDTATAMENLQITQLHPTGMNIPCYMIPYASNVKFFGRSTEVEILRIFLDPNKSRENLKAIAICGTGGIGKTQLALHYANTAMDSYDVVVWIPAETKIKMTSALSKFVAKLGLPQAEGNEGDYRSIQIVWDRLRTSRKTFLLIFDNLRQHNLLDEIWPTSVQGSIIITCRSNSLAWKWTSDIINLPCFDVKREVEVFYSLIGQRPSNDKDLIAAKELLQLLGGLPLAIAQVGIFMNDCGYSYEQVLPIYRKSAKKIFARTQASVQYEHTTDTVWEFSFQGLSAESKTLLYILAFFDPKLIPESILSDKRAGITDSRLEFLCDDSEFRAAVAGLTEAALVNHLPTHKAISIHRLIQQFTAFSRLSMNEAGSFFKHVIKMLPCSFPNTWNQRSHQQGHGWASWEACRTILPHVSWLIRLTQAHSFPVIDPELFAELVFRTGKFLWEQERPITGTYFIHFGLNLGIKHPATTYAQAYRILGHIALDIAQPKAALSAYFQAFTVRELIHGTRSPEVADVYDSIAYSYAEQGKVDDALYYLQKAGDIHNENDPLRMGRTQAIYALTYLRAGRPGDSLNALHHCWKLQNLTEEQVLLSKYPKHSGDIILLSRIKYAQGLKEEAQQLALKTIGIRQGLYGDKGPRVADSTFIVARMLEAEDENTLAAKLLRSVIKMSKGIPEMQAHLARSLWFLSRVEYKIGNNSMAEELKMGAREEQNKIRGREGVDEDTDASFMSLAPWMLW